MGEQQEYEVNEVAVMMHGDPARIARLMDLLKHGGYECVEKKTKAPRKSAAKAK